MLFASREFVSVNKEEIAELITAEHGKVLSDAAINAGYGSVVDPIGGNALSAPSKYIEIAGILSLN